MGHRPKQHYLVRVQCGNQLTLTIVHARDADDATQIVSREHCSCGAEINALLLDSQSAYNELHQQFRRRYIEGLQRGDAAYLADWQFTVTSVDKLG